VGVLRLRRWFLPDTPDVLGMLREQMAVTMEGMDALVAWAGGDDAASETLRDCEHRADEHKRTLRSALTAAFTTPLEPEDIFELSKGLDTVLNGAKDAVREAEVMALPPDAATGEMAELLAEGIGDLSTAFDGLSSDGAAATQAADAAVKSQRKLERVYRRAMSELLEIDDVRTVTARRELYRRFARLSDGVVEVAERVWYSVVKES
jgi:uncharacterized protein Yka (UPF0111/DUF47 family)